MKANELRIGNWVYSSDREDESIYEVVRLESEDYTSWNSGDDYNVIAKMEGKGNNYYYELNPSGIPLTEDWLREFGFIDDYGNYWIDLKTHYLELIEVKGFWYPSYVDVAELSSEYEQRVGLNRIQYVHQLQNLFFALTGKELERK